jgi:transcriptional regulator with XRE-family HTH domain|tara:strand:- start:640 stop:825 length:186 start_codon:yes stop_codon:yes gene_type:complete
MNIEKYIKSKGFPLATAAAELDVTRQALNLWINGKRIPRPAQMKKIQNWSEGEVTAMDFYK